MPTSAQLAMTWQNVKDTWCEALFAEMVATAINRTLQQFGIRGCAGRMAQEFGDHPDAAASRMRWVHDLADHGRLTAHTATCGAAAA
jgi:hypothetical protein